MKNILAENMRRFYTKNLNEQTMPDPSDLMSNMMSNDAHLKTPPAMTQDADAI